MSADSWQQTGMPSDRSYPSGQFARVGRRPDPGLRGGRPTPPPPPRRRAADRDAAGDMRRAERRGTYDSGAFPRPAAPRYAGDTGRTPRRASEGYPADRRAAEPRGASARSGRPAPAPERGSRLRGIVAVLAVFVLTLVGAAADGVLGSGLGAATLGALAVSTVLAAWLVRRRDLATVVIAPPLVFVTVAAVDMAVASSKLSLPAVATMLIRGFPAMGIATGLAIVVTLIRLAARR